MSLAVKFLLEFDSPGDAGVRQLAAAAEVVVAQVAVVGQHGVVELVELVDSKSVVADELSVGLAAA